jgi:hypothetical protein
VVDRSLFKLKQDDGMLWVWRASVKDVSTVVCTLGWVKIFLKKFVSTFYLIIYYFISKRLPTTTIGLLAKLLQIKYLETAYIYHLKTIIHIFCSCKCYDCIYIIQFLISHNAL